MVKSRGVSRRSGGLSSPVPRMPPSLPLVRQRRVPGVPARQGAAVSVPEPAGPVLLFQFPEHNPFFAGFVRIAPGYRQPHRAGGRGKTGYWKDFSVSNRYFCAASVAPLRDTSILNTERLTPPILVAFCQPR